MKFINIPMALFIPFFLMSCSSNEPEIISKVKSLQIPVIQKKNYSRDNNQISLNYFHSKNISDISNLTTFLKKSYVIGSDSRDIFDGHSQTHQAYIALTNLEQAGMVNETYYNDNNIQGITALNGVLSQIEKEIKSQSN
ncbi:hypothetical protein [Citrobacter gillenii]|jgi:hypothetical protein|uniref:Uncharacterized protein n=1 Tax=Citrobacter gillenii TaxID=67828 RepID=A0ABD6M389_9ENTR|nr:hypothetical protein [Citrobacter gillenii]NTZ51057.1 hypothetical protein [Citrobacter gillenii]